MKKYIKLLYVDDEPLYHKSFVRFMRNQKGFKISTASDGVSALKEIEVFSPDIIMTDMKMPHMDGMALLKEVKSKHPHIFVIIITGHNSIQDAVASIKLGAYDYILKPFDFHVINLLLGNITSHIRTLEKEVSFEEPDSKKYQLGNIIGQDQKMFRIYKLISKVAGTKVPVLITGESGTGKELVAEAIHLKSKVNNKPFVKVNCAAITDTLIASELFGHERGAFTGAVAMKKGYFEIADKGTIFLDEIGDVPLQTQVSLLRILELGTFQRVGSTKTINVNTRIVCASNKDLSHEIRQKRFREDLFYRINVVSINIPPLRDRVSDIPILSKYFIERSCRTNKIAVKEISKATMRALLKYTWPGNVRELSNVIERAVILSHGNKILPCDLPKSLTTAPLRRDFELTLTDRSLPKAESILIRKVLEENYWNLTQASKFLEIARGTLYSKMKKYGIVIPR